MIDVIGILAIIGGLIVFGNIISEKNNPECTCLYSKDGTTTVDPWCKKHL